MPCAWPLAVVLTVAAAGEPPRPVEFNRDVRPILSENCYRCHGPDKGNRKAGLRLDVREAAVNAGAVAPGDPDGSELVARITSTDSDLVMPPPNSHKALTAAQKQTLRRWVAEGAIYQPHWSLVPPTRAPVPPTRFPARNPIDAFIRARLERETLDPSPQAPKHTLIRRLSLDLLGLPPTPDEVDAYLADPAPDATDRLVERLLASPHYGERMAVPWLDLARFADTVGYHGDQNQNVFPYRDYVIGSFNANKPFDLFTREQLAGDLLPGATTEQRVATGFNRLNMMTREGGVQLGEYLARYAADRVRAVSTTWLGTTVGCAECHDHKFDPVGTRDFYRLAAFFADVKQWGVYGDYQYTPIPELKRFKNDHPFPPELRVRSDALTRRLERLRAETGCILDAADGSGSAAWAGESLRFLDAHPDGWATPRPEVVGDTKAFEVRANGSFAATMAKGAELAVTLRIAGPVAAVRVELLPDDRRGGAVVVGDPYKAPVVVAATLGGKPVPFYHAAADRLGKRYKDGSEVVGVQTGWVLSEAEPDRPHTSVWLAARPVDAGDGAALAVRVKNYPQGRVRVSVSPFAADEPYLSDWRVGLAAALKSGGPLARRAFVLSTGRDPEALARYRALEREILECRGGWADTLVTESVPPLTTRVLPRGNWQDESGEVVRPGVPAAFGPPPPADGRRLTRLDLADWLTAPENPLTARVFVNRLWKQFFGTGLSAVVDDLGSQGEWPVHPELLDWLAVEFRDSGWDVKHMVRLIVGSATYRQSSDRGPGLRAADPDNRLIGGQSPRRLDAEFVRDNALAAAGLLNPEVGGPSAKPYQPAGYYVDLQHPVRDYAPDRDGRQYRRGLYAHWQRTFLHPMLANFDAPAREECTASRPEANTPQQALTLLNDPTFVEAARAFAGRVIVADGDKLAFAFRHALARPPTDEERRSLEAFLAGQRARYRAAPADAAKLLGVGLAPRPAGDPAELAAWTNVCRVILNLNETITRY